MLTLKTLYEIDSDNIINNLEFINLLCLGHDVLNQKVLLIMIDKNDKMRVNAHLQASFNSFLVETYLPQNCNTVPSGLVFHSK